MRAYVFPGQGAQFPGMGKDIFQNNKEVQSIFRNADDILGFEISKIMFEGSMEDLTQTNVTQPSVFIHSVAVFKSLEEPKPDMVAGHSLGEFSALVANNVLSFEDALILVSKRASAMQKACEKVESTMAAILALDDDTVIEICEQVNGTVVAANFNSPGQVVISGEKEAVTLACEKAKQAGAKRALPLKVGGAFHSPLMKPAEEELKEAIEQTDFKKASCPVYQNFTALPSVDPETIRKNLINQLTGPVKWVSIVNNMVNDGAELFVECGPGKVLQGLVKKIAPKVQTDSA